MSEFTKAQEAVKTMRELTGNNKVFAQLQLAVAEGLNRLADAIINKDIGVHKGELNIRHRSGG